jgi:hypothetical protein
LHKAILTVFLLIKFLQWNLAQNKLPVF